MEIEIGGYVRTKDGEIGKIISIDKSVDGIERDILYIAIDRYRELVRFKSAIISHSKNIIDLLEEGDFVNGEKVIQISKEDGLVFVDKKYYDARTCEERHCVYKNNEIKTILTKGQYEANCYVVKE